MNSQTKSKRIHLADDDEDDRSFFEDAIKELGIETQLIMSTNGAELMKILDDTVPPPPYVIFLDLNMPRKNGFECLLEIRKISKLMEIMVVIFSTSSKAEIVDKAFHLGANYYICKPSSFELLKKAIKTVLLFTVKQQREQPPRDKFFLTLN